MEVQLTPLFATVGLCFSTLPVAFYNSAIITKLYCLYLFAPGAGKCKQKRLQAFPEGI